MTLYKKIFKDYIIPVLVALVLTLLINKFLLFKIYIPSESMVPTLKVGDQAFATKIYNYSKIKRGDILVFNFAPENQLFIKRVIGLPGETVKVDDNGDVYINGTKLNEPYVKNPDKKAGNFVVPKDCYLFMGDNRANSNDARYWSNPYINEKDIRGKAQLIVYPFSRFGFLK
ncbi:signal peptidase I [Clostridium sp. 19966]|uniref:signal peptidase I n=1 Tax=Clostridium sp. 19966 TaxID=2768166 RepID=UPI0028DD75E5|nr:signal peptidase I [Clostridium sp. 19966]MDT8718705.1 signal peptidase I [Clostridium sp. 19966]